MRILHLHSSDNSRAAGGVLVMNRLHDELKRHGLESRILCGVKTTSADDVRQIGRPARLESVLRQATSRMGLNDIHAISAFSVLNDTEYLAADVLHIHGPHPNFFSYLALPTLTRRKPTIFTLHDMWALTGHCAISYDCERWRTGCGRCPYPDANPPVRRDATAIDWRLKRWAYSRSSFYVAAPSRWLAERARQSILNRFPVHYLPHGIDTSVYEPLDPEVCRRLLALPAGKKVLMFAAVRLNQRSKGGDLLIKALQLLPASLRREMVLLLLGEQSQEIARSTDIPVVSLGYIGNDRIKALAYAAADVYVSPTRAEAFGLTLLESMACGTPMVTFNVGGVTETVRPGETGYLARPEDAQDLCDGIVALLSDNDGRQRAGVRCREIAVAEYSLETHVQRYIDLYHQSLSA
ncbi:MAG: glycosyltransferase [Chloroflexales bacterium]|nr:glycosyltransferase [Chloroflexales bacterium]